ncbi:hypothetical protein ACO1O0_001243 [Amphichorda felina]
MHTAGEAPPELSPLDAFALQSRMLAKQLQASEKDGQRMSRLPPLTVESPLIVQGRSDYFRSMSNESGSEPGQSPGEDVSAGLGLRTEYQDAFDPDDRPRSMHPRMSRVSPPPDESIPPVPQPPLDDSRGRPLDQVEENPSYFGARRERSPSLYHSDTQSQPDRQIDRLAAGKDNSFPPLSPLRRPSYPDSPERPKQGSIDELGLVPPRSLFPQRSSSIISSPLLLPEDDSSSNMGGSFHSLPPHSHPSFVFADDSAHTPVSMHSDAFPDVPPEEKGPGAPSYIYSKFTLPRGKCIQRSDDPEAQTQVPSRWDQPMVPPGMQCAPMAPPSPPSRPSTSSARPIADDAVSMMSSMTRPSMDASKVSMDSSRLAADYPPPPAGRHSNDGSRSSEEAPRGRARTSTMHEVTRGRTPASQTGTSDSASTIRPPPTARSAAPTASEMSAEEHLAKGIECHENGSLQESTYHLRYAARLNDPTAMLLYALACRHGWGMRANQKEGVQWLRKAAEYAQIEIADDEDQAKGGKHVDAIERRTRKAQFALSIYELGVSHMNGWGIEQDKALALRCFEIAGTWGDVDALAEAGFCYAQGIGCKKNLKKSAKFYRMAEAKGMSMVGNSWIHKPKYMDEEKGSPKKDKKKARSKSRTRTMLGLKS